MTPPPLRWSPMGVFVVFVLWWFANLAAYSVILILEGNSKFLRDSIYDPKDVVIPTTGMAVFLAPAAAALAYVSYQVICGVRKIPARRILPKQAKRWWMPPLLLAPLLWLYICITAFAAVFFFSIVGDPRGSADDYVTLPIAAGFSGFFMAFPAGIVGLPLTLCATFGIALFTRWRRKRSENRRSD